MPRGFEVSLKIPAVSDVPGGDTVASSGDSREGDTFNGDLWRLGLNGGNCHCLWHRASLDVDRSTHADRLRAQSHREGELES
jgi:hypothetical protein